MTPHDRSYTLEFHDDRQLAHFRWRAGGDGRAFSWKLRIHGNGHWCVGGGMPYRFQTEEEARRVGELWNETGLQPCEQTEDRISAVRREFPEHLTRQQQKGVGVTRFAGRSGLLRTEPPMRSRPYREPAAIAGGVS